MIVEQFRTGGDRNFGYLAASEKGGAGVVVDPSYDPEGILAVAEQWGVTISYIFCTHGHCDHTERAEVLGQAVGVPVLIFGDREPNTGRVVADGATFPLADDLGVKVIHTPGHTEDSICLLVGEALFTGDTLFVGKVGGTDLGEQARQEYASLHNKLLKLPDATHVWPGHDYGVRPASTIGEERRENPFLLRPDLESFIDLKRNWTAYKAEHGIS